MTQENGVTKMENERCFSEATDRTDIELVVEDKSFHVNKHVLAEISPVFEKMFFGNFKEKDQKKVELPGKSYSEMLEFLRCVYPPTDMSFSNKHVVFLLPLADEYQVDVLFKKCLTAATNMVKHGGNPAYRTDKTDQYKVYNKVDNNHTFVMTYLLMAQTNGIKELETECIWKLSEFDSTAVEKTEEYDKLHDDVMTLLFVARVRYLEHRMCYNCRRKTGTSSFC